MTQPESKEPVQETSRENHQSNHQESPQENDQAKACCIPESATPWENSLYSQYRPGAFSPCVPGFAGSVGESREHPELVEIPAGCFLMGADNAPHPEDGEGPIREVALSGFTIAQWATTNAEFAAFVEATGYQTEAERAGGAFVFVPHGQVERDNYLEHAPWWSFVHGASWRNPAGPGSLPVSDHPVVQVAYHDALAYANWMDARLPTEAEWEYAARGGLEQQPYPWGEDLLADGAHRCNIWQGEFPHTNTGEDGFSGTAPARSFEPNGFGLYNMAGNIWEWCADRFTRLHGPQRLKNPQGPLSGKRFVMKGGSHLCHASYCYRYRTSSRTANLPNNSASHTGFRIAR